MMNRIIRKYNKGVLPYFLISTITLFVIIGYLAYAHEKMRTGIYIFKRNYIDKDVVKLIESRKGNFFDIEGDLSVDQWTCYLNQDSSVCILALVTPDSLSQYPNGFYKYDFEKKKVDYNSLLTSFDIKDNYNNYLKRILALGGVFFESSEYITYSCFYTPNIYVFRKNGDFVSHIKTEDNVPLPEISKYKDYYLLVMGKTHNSNMASFVYKENVYVISSQIERNLGKYVIDCYSLSTGDYLYSFYVDNAASEGNGIVNSLKMNRDVVELTTPKCKTIFRMR